MDLPHWSAHGQDGFSAGVRGFQITVLLANDWLVRSVPHLEAREDSAVLAPVELGGAGNTRQVTDDVSIIASLRLSEPSDETGRHHIVNTVKLE